MDDLATRSDTIERETSPRERRRRQLAANVDRPLKYLKDGLGSETVCNTAHANHPWRSATTIDGSLANY